MVNLRSAGWIFKPDTVRGSLAWEIAKGDPSPSLSTMKLWPPERGAPVEVLFRILTDERY